MNSVTLNDNHRVVVRDKTVGFFFCKTTQMVMCCSLKDEVLIEAPTCITGLWTGEGVEITFSCLKKELIVMWI